MRARSSSSVVISRSSISSSRLSSRSRSIIALNSSSSRSSSSGLPPPGARPFVFAIVCAPCGSPLAYRLLIAGSRRRHQHSIARSERRQYTARAASRFRRRDERADERQRLRWDEAVHERNRFYGGQAQQQKRNDDEYRHEGPLQAIRHCTESLVLVRLLILVRLIEYVELLGVEGCADVDHLLFHFELAQEGVPEIQNFVEVRSEEHTSELQS